MLSAYHFFKFVRKLRSADTMPENKNKLREYPRDLVGYNGVYLDHKWPERAKVAIQFVLNYEEGAKNCILHGDQQSETFLSEIIVAPTFENARHMSMGSIYEYGSRAGVWRILTLFRERQVPITIFGVAMAMQRRTLWLQTVKSWPELVKSEMTALLKSGWMDENRYMLRKWNEFVAA
tara:strand:- start:1980 stop:2513 length:534 start_codon:yes stop_codon:yes gene_type:complete